MPGSETLTGKVLSANANGIKLEGRDDWLNYTKKHDVTHASRGDTVEIKVSGDWINELSVVSSSNSYNGTANQQQYDNRQTSIERLACLKAAAEFLGRLSQTHEDVKSDHVTILAEKFYHWVGLEPPADE